MVKNKGQVVNRIRELRQKAGLTQADVAEATGASRQTINAIEAGKYAPSMELAFKIVRALNAEFSDVFRWRE